MAGADDEEDAVASQVFIPWRQQSGEGIHVWSIPNERQAGERDRTFSTFNPRSHVQQPKPAHCPKKNLIP